MKHISSEPPLSASAATDASTAMSAYRFSEYACLALIQKISDLQKLDVIVATNHSAILTPPALITEIQRVLDDSGRVSVYELSERLSVEQRYVDSAVTALCQSNQSVQRVNSILLSSRCIVGILDSLYAKLTAVGCLSLINEAKSLSLPLSFLHSIVDRQHSDGQFDYQCEREKILYTKTFIDEHRQSLVKILIKVSDPTPLKSIQSSHSELVDFLVYDQTLTLIKDKLINGSLVGQSSYASAVYRPESFDQSQLKRLREFYVQNQYIPFSRLESVLKGKNRSEFLSSEFVDGVSVGDSVLLNAKVLAPIIEIVEDAVCASEFVSNLSDLLPPSLSSLSSTDYHAVIALIVQRVNRSHGDSAVCESIHDKFIVSKQFFASLQARVSEAVEQLAVDWLLQQQKREQAELQSSLEQPLKAADDDHYDDFDVDADAVNTSGSQESTRDLRTGGAKSKKSANKSKKAPLNQPRQPATASSMAPGHLPPLTKSALTKLVKGYWTVEEMPLELITAATDRLMPAIAQLYQSSLQQLIDVSSNTGSGDSSGLIISRKQWSDALVKRLQDLSDSIQQFSQAIDTLADDKETASEDVGLLQSQLDSHLCKTLCQALLDSVLRYFAAINKLTRVDDETIIDNSDAADQLARSLPDTQRRAIVDSIPSANSKSLLESMSSAINDSNSKQFLERFGSLVSLSEWKVNTKLDRKSKKMLVFHLRQSMQHAIVSEQRSAVIALLATIILHSKLTSTLLHLPARCVTGVVQWLKPSILSDAHQSLRQLVVLNSILATMDKPVTEIDVSDSGLTVSAVMAMSTTDIESRIGALTDRVKSFACDPASVINDHR